MKKRFEKTFMPIKALFSLLLCLGLSVVMTACSSVSKKAPAQDQEMSAKEGESDEETRDPSSVNKDVKEIMTDFHKRQRSLIYRK